MTGAVPVKYTPRPQQFSLSHSSPYKSCACEVCWTERAVAAERELSLADRRHDLEEARIAAFGLHAEQQREWWGQQLSMFRTWSHGMMVIARLPLVAWAAVEIVRLVLVGP